MLFSIEQNNKMLFIDVNTIREKGKFTTNVFQKPTVRCV